MKRSRLINTVALAGSIAVSMLVSPVAAQRGGGTPANLPDAAHGSCHPHCLG